MAKNSLPSPSAGTIVSRTGYFTRPRNKRPTIAPVGKVATDPNAQRYMDVPGDDLSKGGAKEGSRKGLRPQSV